MLLDDIMITMHYRRHADGAIEASTFLVPHPDPHSDLAVAVVSAWAEWLSLREARSHPHTALGVMP